MTFIIVSALYSVDTNSALLRKIWFDFQFKTILALFYKSFAYRLSYIFAENFDQIYRLVKDYGSFVRVWLGPELNVVVTDPNDAEVRKNIQNQIDRTVFFKYSNFRSAFFMLC